MNPIEQTRYIENKFRKYIKSTFQLNDTDYNSKFIRELDTSKLIKGPYIIPTLPFSSSKSLKELIIDGKASKLWENLKNINLERKLYDHQVKAFEKISNGKNVVITTGTGSGKTESFLYPIINSILKEIEEGKNTTGIRAIFLYPMNALVNDQIERLREILSDYPQITYGYYTGDTKPSEGNIRESFEEKNGYKIPSNELISREEIRNSPPHLLFTNYSMLEYLLIRPKDSFLFDKNYTRSWKYIVLDEAHTYSGALGIELSYLLKRATGLVEKKPQFILTSATLGKGKEDINDIIEFAHNLTSSEYEYDDIIFGKRDALDYTKPIYSLTSEEIDYAYENRNNINKLKDKFSKKIGNIDIKDENEFLYELLLRDSNIYVLYNILTKDGIKKYSDVLNEFNMKSNFSENTLANLIKILNIAKKNNKPLYDNKYHTFIRTLSGAFITIDKEKELKINNHIKINGKQAFEIGVCKHCNQMFLIGKNINNYLVQNQNIDIDENYDEFEDANVEYYILKDDIKLVEEDHENLEEYTICSSCGQLDKKNNINKIDCECGIEYKRDVYKVLNNNSKMKNNLSTCPCCKNTSTTGGVVIGFNIGKDRATALISQILYETLKSNYSNNTTISKLSLFSSSEDNRKKIDTFEKQFLAFSDSRQQASYFATFFNYNYKRILRKRIIWEALKENNYNSLPIYTLVNKLTNIIEENNLFDGRYSSDQEAWISILNELLLVDGNNSAEGLGLFSFRLNPNVIKKCLDEFKEDEISDFLEMYNITINDLYNIISIILEMFRTSSAIDIDDTTIDANIRKEELGYRSSINYVTYKKEKGSKYYNNIKSYIPVAEYMSNKAVDYVERCLRINSEKAIKFLELIFKIVKVGILKKYTLSECDAYRIELQKYILESYKANNYYKCDKCQKLTLYNVKGVCPTRGCNGTLSLYDIEKSEDLKNNYYRNEYMNKQIERMIIKEHTAQLGKETAKEYQNDFKNKKINILSCSTTFEMGVDIGSLENVFLRNVPPSPSNYVQRAGRAGRGKDSSAFILTFCSNSSHDYNYFCDPSKMILGIVEPPKFKVNNEKIIIRHLTAAALGFFFKKYPSYYKNVDKFIFDNGIDNFKTYLESKPDDLNNYITQKILNNESKELYKDFKWTEKLFDINGDLEKFKDSIKSSIQEYLQASEEAEKDKNWKLSGYYGEQIKNLKNGRIIDNLTRYNVIPKYGFPVDVVDLIVYEKDGMKNTKYDLSRDLSISISEYAPESEVIVDDNKYTSRYLIKPQSITDLTKYYYFECEKCKKVSFSITNPEIKICQFCGQVSNGKKQYFIQPIYGFATDRKNIESRNIKPKKTYSSEVKYIGNGEKVDEIKEIKNVLKLEPLKDDELVVLNENPFYRCLECGYSKIDRNGFETINIEHNNKNGYRCKCQKLERYSLGHKFKTDVIKIQINNRLTNYYEAIATLYALLEGISLSFNIDRNDIDGLVTKDENDNWILVIFDNVPGGAGYVKNILDEKKIIKAFSKALEKVSQDCCDENTSCYNCLRNYKNQKIHKILRRKYAKQLLTEVLRELEQ